MHIGGEDLGGVSKWVRWNGCSHFPALIGLECWYLHQTFSILSVSDSRSIWSVPTNLAITLDAINC